MTLFVNNCNIIELIKGFFTNRELKIWALMMQYKMAHIRTPLYIRTLILPYFRSRMVKIERKYETDDKNMNWRDKK